MWKAFPESFRSSSPGPLQAACCAPSQPMGWVSQGPLHPLMYAVPGAGSLCHWHQGHLTHPQEAAPRDPKGSILSGRGFSAGLGEA